MKFLVPLFTKPKPKPIEHLTKEYIVPAVRQEMIEWKYKILKEVKEAVVATEERMTLLERFCYGNKDTYEETQKDQTAKG